MSVGVVHSRIRNGKRVYRLWFGTLDRYGTKEMTREEAAAQLLADAQHTIELDIADALRRADGCGTSGRGYLAEPGDPWTPERCRACGAFHHAFKERWTSDAKCARCGESETSIAHAPPCPEGLPR